MGHMPWLLIQVSVLFLFLLHFSACIRLQERYMVMLFLTDSHMTVLLLTNRCERDGVETLVALPSLDRLKIYAAKQTQNAEFWE